MIISDTSDTQGNGMAQESPVPGPDTFDLTRYVEGKSTVPQFPHIVYLDQAAGAELANTEDEIQHLTDRRQAILIQQNKMSESPSHALVDDEAEKLALELEEINSQLPVLEKRIGELKQQIISNSLTLVFEVPPSKKLGKVFRAAQKEYEKAHGKRKDTDVEQAEYVMLAQLQSFCVEIRTPDGSVRKPPTKNGFPREGFESLLGKLIPSQSVRLMNALNNAMDASADWAKRIDAGFPGGSPDVEREPVDHTHPEGVQVLERSTSDSATGA